MKKGKRVGKLAFYPSVLGMMESYYPLGSGATSGKPGKSWKAAALSLMKWEREPNS